MTTDDDRATTALHRIITNQKIEIAHLRQVIAEKDKQIETMRNLENLADVAKTARIIALERLGNAIDEARKFLEES